MLTGDLAQVIGLMQQSAGAFAGSSHQHLSAEAMIDMARAVAAMYAATAYKLTGDVTAASERRAAEAIAPVRATGYLTETLNGYTSLACSAGAPGAPRHSCRHLCRGRAADPWPGCAASSLSAAHPTTLAWAICCASGTTSTPPKAIWRAAWR